MTPGDLDARCRELLAEASEFVLGREPSGLAMLPGSAALKCIGGDASGGCLYLWHAQREAAGGRVPVVYLSCYGETARIAADFAEAVTLAAAMPGYWLDALTAAHKGADVLVRVVARSEADLDEEYAEARAELCARLGLDTVGVSARLLAAVRAVPAFAPLLASEDGMVAAGSFGARPYPQ